MRRAAELGIEFEKRLPDRHVGAVVDAAALAAILGGPLPDEGVFLRDAQGKGELCVRFPTGAIQVIASEP